MNKKEWRHKIKSALQELSKEEHHIFSTMIKNRLLKQPFLKDFQTIAITISKPPEVDTYGIIEELWGMEKRVVVPKCNPTLRTMDFYEILSFSQLETVYMDLKEPIPSETVYVSPEEIDMVIVPGIVFDHKGYRIGYGGGYYDRYLSGYKGRLVSLAFHLQLVDELPYEAHDIPVDVIITEKASINCAENRRG